MKKERWVIKLPIFRFISKKKLLLEFLCWRENEIHPSDANNIVNKFLDKKIRIMTSKNKKRKLKNSFCVGGWLKNKTIRLKRFGFYNASKRAVDKKIDKEII